MPEKKQNKNAEKKVFGDSRYTLYKYYRVHSQHEEPNEPCDDFSFGHTVRWTGIFRPRKAGRHRSVVAGHDDRGDLHDAPGHRRHPGAGGRVKRQSGGGEGKKETIELSNKGPCGWGLLGGL